MSSALILMQGRCNTSYSTVHICMHVEYVYQCALYTYMCMYIMIPACCDIASYNYSAVVHAYVS